MYSAPSADSKGIGDDPGDDTLSQIYPASLYLHSGLGRALSSCMKELCLHQPKDPIEFMAHWLYRYADFVLYTQEKAALLKRAEIVMKELARERNRRKERLLVLFKQYSELKIKLAEVSPFTYKSIFVQKSASKKQKGYDHYFDRMIASLSSSTTSKLPIQSPNLSRAVSTRKSKYSKASSLLQRIAGEIGKSSAYKEMLGTSRDGTIREREGTIHDSRRSREGTIHEGTYRPSLLARSFPSARKKKFGTIESEGDDDNEEAGEEEEEEEEEDEESGDASNREGMDFKYHKTKELKRLKSLRVAAKDSLTASKPWYSRDSATQAYWIYEFPPGRIVCLHPLLGKLMARGPKVNSLDMQSCLQSDSPCQSLYNHEVYVCLPEEMLFVTPEHVDSKQMLEPESEDMERSERDEKTSPNSAETEEEPKSFSKTEVLEHKAAGKESERIDPEKAKRDGNDQKEEEDDIRWQTCKGDEVCEGWIKCEGFDQDRWEDTNKE